MIAAVLLGGEQEHAELGAVETAGVRRVHLRSADVPRRVRGDAPVDVGEAVEAAYVDSRRSIVDAASPVTRTGWCFRVDGRLGSIPGTRTELCQRRTRWS